MSAAASCGLLVVDKAGGLTSHDVCMLVRRALGIRRVGHAGTLDPMATGVLVVGVGEATKLLGHLAADEKTYEAVIRLGVATHTLDADGRVVAEAPLPRELDIARVRGVADRFVGVLEQRAPIVSALRAGGSRLHERARRGEPVDPPVRRVVCRAIDVLGVEHDRIALRVRCGKGFYVRSLARDLAAALGTVGHLAALRRTQAGPFDVGGALSCETLRAAAAGDVESRSRLESARLSLREAWGNRPVVWLDADGARDVGCGRPVALERVASGSVEPGVIAAALDADGRLVALVERGDGDVLRVVRGFGARGA
ncbi:MAG: tRNA pseudouridine(55) synthase TruB [Myxococcota bacterium]|nr:tRNA pseudouridine(55) synthase TruB [Myxococcota bacterium]MDW8363000.1 tRNA pseudouridine(55) synthase TruB [Myxococcales bacterium]